MEKHAFQAETQKLLDLMIHSLYSNKEIFLRELISNASDALDRRRFESLSNTELQADRELAIDLVADRTTRTLSVADNGIGMSQEDLVENLGTIARSGTLEFLRRSETDDALAPDLIGQFGVGFYASFMVADEVEVLSRRAGEEGATRWVSKGAGEYSVEQAEREEAGTTIRLHLNAVDAEAGIADFCDEWVLRESVKKYSDFVAYPIRLTLVEAADEAGEAAEEAAEVRPADSLPSRREIEEPLNSMKAIWTRPESDTSTSPTTSRIRCCA
jgi:molecular chaperone HtpG